MEYVKIAQTGDLPNGGKKKISVADKEILLVNIEDQFYAVDNTCTHMGGSLVNGKLEGFNVICPRHGSSFDVRSGKLVQPGKILFKTVKATDLNAYPVKVEGSDILVGIE